MKSIGPTFILIGPGRSGTSWIYEALLEHPEVCMAEGTKETLYFDRNYERGIGWYRNFFFHCTSAQAIGEVSNSYLANKKVPERIKKEFPDVKLISCLRNPFERIVSSYLYRKRAGTIVGSFNEAILKYPDLISENYYWEHIDRYRSYFNDTQLNLLFFDDLKNRPDLFLENLFEIIGVDQYFKPRVMDQKINTANKTVIPGLEKLFRFMADGLRKFGFLHLLSHIKRSVVVRSLLFRKIKTKKEVNISPQSRKVLKEKFKPEIKKLEKYTGRDLSSWLISFE